MGQTKCSIVLSLTALALVSSSLMAYLHYQRLDCGKQTQLAPTYVIGSFRQIDEFVCRIPHEAMNSNYQWDILQAVDGAVVFVLLEFVLVIKLEFYRKYIPLLRSACFQVVIPVIQ